MRKSLDVRRLGAAASYPGIDPRIWVAMATVTDIGFDADEGIFADVQLQPDGDIFTAYVATPYAGNGYGAHYPLEVGDTVLVAIPLGDADGPSFIIARAWNAADKPMAEAGSGEDIVEEVVIKTKSGKSYKLLTPDAQILFQNASQSFVRGEDLRTALNDFANALTTAAAALGPPPGGGAPTPLTTANGATFIAGLQQAALALSQAANTYLSTKIKGE